MTQYVVYKSGGSLMGYGAGRIESETPKQIKLARATLSARQIRADQVVARFDAPDRAAHLVNAVNGVRGEYQRRERAAWEAAQAAIADLIERATK